MTRVLDVVDWDKVIAKGDPEAWLYFYEDFLEIYDNKLRKLTGSYYTPPQVVQAMVRLCDEALKSPEAVPMSAGAGGAVKCISPIPAMGSGTFLLGHRSAGSPTRSPRNRARARFVAGASAQAVEAALWVRAAVRRHSPWRSCGCSPR